MVFFQQSICSFKQQIHFFHFALTLFFLVELDHIIHHFYSGMAVQLEFVVYAEWLLYPFAGSYYVLQIHITWQNTGSEFAPLHVDKQGSCASFIGNWGFPESFQFFRLVEIHPAGGEERTEWPHWFELADTPKVVDILLAVLFLGLLQGFDHYSFKLLGFLLHDFPLQILVVVIMRIVNLFLFFVF